VCWGCKFIVQDVIWVVACEVGEVCALCFEFVCEHV